MATSERRADRGRQRGLRFQAEVGRAYRMARRSLGLSQRRLAELAGGSQAEISRLEQGKGGLGITELCIIGDLLGLDLVVAVHPGGAPVRDAGHVRVMARLKRRLPGHFEWKTEVPVPRMGDRRAIDAMLVSPAISAGFELETRLTDAQALVRRALLKQRDADLACMILVFPDTDANRAAVEAASATLRPAFPLHTRAVLAALRAGRTPPANGILFV